MTKITSKDSKKSTRSTRVMRDARTGQFTLGHEAFASISSVEGITLSKGMRKDLARTSGMSADKRRSELTGIYGKKK